MTEHEQRIADHVAAMNKHLRGECIKEVRYCDDDERKQMGLDEGEDWVVILFKTGHKLVLSQDPEGNGPGAAFTTYQECQVIC